MDELNLDPKFGLVTPISNGSHFDMNYHTMLSAKDAILPYFGQMFAHGWQAHHEEQLFQKARSIGLEAETAMFQATKGINAYKGLIFNLGLMSSAFAYVITHQAPLKTMFPTIATMTKNLIKDFEEPKTTAGYEAYLKYRTMGARGEAMNGFPTVQQLIPMLNDFNDLTLLKVLIEAIKMTEDTVLIRRAGSYDMAKKIQSWFFNIDVSDSEALMQLTKRCIEANISFGGAADLLVCAILYCRLAKTFAF
jgi:triphosphoribosyl-dephospho-CoA synthetase